jgi:chromosome segregation ATPase
MTTTPTTLTYTLEEFLARFEQKMDRQFAEVNQKLEKIDERLSKLEIGQAELSGEIKALDERLTGQIKALDERLTGQIKALDERLTGQIKALDERVTGQIKTLDEKVSGIDKRLDNQEFINRGILVAVVIALLSGAAKLFDILPSIK